MNYKVSKEWIANKTRYRGTIKASYFELVRLFGEPQKGDGFKTQAEWHIEFEDGVITTIYDWKFYRPVEYNNSWNVGGTEPSSLTKLESLMESSVNSQLIAV
ncbi:MAG: hypothetical protein CL885_00890 [Dehalococcoidia bacterium]|nr:hypothetical protein [Dehalococcoidia bacterium]